MQDYLCLVIFQSILILRFLILGSNKTVRIFKLVIRLRSAISGYHAEKLRQALKIFFSFHLNSICEKVDLVFKKKLLNRTMKNKNFYEKIKFHYWKSILPNLATNSFQFSHKISLAKKFYLFSQSPLIYMQSIDLSWDLCQKGDIILLRQII